MMKQLIPLLFTAIVITAVQSSCRMAPSGNPGDTVAAKFFYPADTTARMAQAHAKTDTTLRDSTDIYYIGTASTRAEVQLVSYPSRRDTLVRAKARHIKVTGNADFGHVVRAKTWVSGKGDTLVTQLEELTTGYSR